MSESVALRHHELKVMPDSYDALVGGSLQHDIRRVTGEPFRPGDRLSYVEVDPVTDAQTGRTATASVTYVTWRETPCALSPDGLHPDFAILSVADVVVGAP